MMTITQIKTFAKRQLRGNKLAAAGAMILIFICTMLWSSAMFSVVFVGIIGPFTGRFVIPEIAGDERLQLLFYVGTGIIIASLLFLGLYLYSGLMLGSQKLYLSIAKGRRVSAFDVFRGFSDGAQLKHYFSVILIIYLIQILIMVPETVIGIISGKGSADYRITSLITTFVTYIASLFLSMSCTASADHPEMGAWKAIGVSLYLMRKRKFKFMMMELSFLGWLLLIIVTFGIAGFWIVPYFNTSFSIFYLSAYGQDYLSTPKDVYVKGDAKPDSVKATEAEAVTTEQDAAKPSVVEAVSAQSESAGVSNGKRSFEEARSQFTDFGGNEAKAPNEFHGDGVNASAGETIEEVNRSADFSGDEAKAPADFNENENYTSIDISRNEVDVSLDETSDSYDLNWRKIDASAEDGGTVESVDGFGSLKIEEGNTPETIDAVAEAGECISEESNTSEAFEAAPEAGSGISEESDTSKAIETAPETGAEMSAESTGNTSEEIVETRDEGSDQTSAGGMNYQDESLNQNEALNEIKADSVSEVIAEVSSDEVKTEIASAVSTETSSEDGIKKNYSTEDDAYAAYVQWKKDHGITVDNPDPFHNIHHKSNGKSDVGSE